MSTVTDFQFEIGDAVKTAFTIMDPSGVAAVNPVVSTLYRKDWQGKITLSTSARTNLHRYSETFANAAWVIGGTLTNTPGQVGPDGGTTAVLLAGIDTGASSMYCYVTVGITTGSRYEPSFWINRVSTAGILGVSNAQTGSAGVWRVDLSLLPDSWVRLTRTHPAVSITTEFTGSANTCGLNFVKISGTGKQSVYIDKVQLDAGTASTAYIAAPGATGSTVTDYSVAGSVATLAPAPVVGALLSWSGTDSNGPFIPGHSGAAASSTFGGMGVR